MSFRHSWCLKINKKIKNNTEKNYLGLQIACCVMQYLVAVVKVQWLAADECLYTFKYSICGTGFVIVIHII